MKKIKILLFVSMLSFAVTSLAAENTRFNNCFTIDSNGLEYTFSKALYLIAQAGTSYSLSPTMGQMSMSGGIWYPKVKRCANKTDNCVYVQGFNFKPGYYKGSYEGGGRYFTVSTKKGFCTFAYNEGGRLWVASSDTSCSVSKGSTLNQCAYTINLKK